MNLMDRLTDDNGRPTTCQVVPEPCGTILCGLATRLLQLFSHHDHDLLLFRVFVFGVRCLKLLRWISC